MASLLTRVLGPNKGRSISLVAAFAMTLVSWSCSRSRDHKSVDAAALGSGSPSSSAAASALQRADPGSGGSPIGRDGDVDGPLGAGAAAAARWARAGDTPFPLDAGRLVLKMDKPLDLGPAGAVVATPSGALFRTLGDDLVGLLLGASPAAAPKRVGGAEDPADASSEEGLASRAPPAAYTRGSYAYWVTHGKLVRRAFTFNAGAPPAALEVLAGDALDGTRVSAESLAPGGRRRDVAIYIARAEKQTGERGARIWVEGAGTAALSSDGSGASSVALAPSDAGLVAVMLDLRSAMSPVHARTIEVGESGPARVGPDVVVFVGPSPEGRTEVAAASSREGPVAFIPFAQDTSSFGLASLLVGREPHLDASVQWRLYPNGLEPAPVAGAVLCGRTWVAYARPSAATPASPQVLVLAPVEKGAFGPELTAAQGFDFMSVSLAPREDGGAWLAWVGNGRSWIRAVRCG